MSDDERDLINGRVLNQYIESIRTLESLRQKAALYAETLRGIADVLTPAKESHSTPSILSVRGMAEKFPSREDLVQLASEIAETERRKRDSATSLAKLGLTVKD